MTDERGPGAKEEEEGRAGSYMEREDIRMDTCEKEKEKVNIRIHGS